MLSEYKFTPSGTKAAPLPSSLRSEAPPDSPAIIPAAKDVVSMAPFEVRETGASNAALMPVAPKKPDNPQAVAAAKLGIGIHYMRLGKVRLFVNTIFYVPILIGFDW
jgi:hypothetical protein